MRGAPVIGMRTEFANHETGQPRMHGFHIDRRDAVVVDERIRQGHDLSPVGRVGADFLVAGHARVEAQFAGGVFSRPEGPAKEDLAVFQGEQGMGMVCYVCHVCAAPLCS